MPAHAACQSAARPYQRTCFLLNLVPTATCRLLFVLVLLAHDRRRVVHVAVNIPRCVDRAAQFRDTFPWDELLAISFAIGIMCAIT